MDDGAATAAICVKLEGCDVASRLKLTLKWSQSILNCIETWPSASKSHHPTRLDTCSRHFPVASVLLARMSSGFVDRVFKDLFQKTSLQQTRLNFITVMLQMGGTEGQPEMEPAFLRGGCVSTSVFDPRLCDGVLGNLTGDLCLWQQSLKDHLGAYISL